MNVMPEVNVIYMQEALVRDLIVALTDNYGNSLAEAMNIVYCSETFRMLKDERTHLYAHSPVYMFDCLEREMKYGKVYV